MAGGKAPNGHLGSEGMITHRDSGLELGLSTVCLSANRRNGRRMRGSLASAGSVLPNPTTWCDADQRAALPDSTRATVRSAFAFSCDCHLKKRQ